MSGTVKRKVIWLSHILDEKTPSYGGDGKNIIEEDKAINKGNSCNTKIFKLLNHSGSHVDVQNHFIENGLKIEDYDTSRWIFRTPKVIDIEVEDSQLITPDLVGDIKGNIVADLILLRTGFERKRGQREYWEKGPGIKVETIDLLLSKFPSMKGLGCDLISVSSLHYREEGRICHKRLLSRNILIFEDMSLINLNNELIEVVALPLRVRGADGSPVTILGYIKE